MNDPQRQNRRGQHTHAQGCALCVLLCLGTALLIFVPYILQGGGAFTLRDDFNTQQLTFTNQVNGFLKTQLPGQWCWNLDLGASFVNGFGFYVLGSPFALPAYLFPRQALPYLIGWLYVLKYVVAGVTGYEYLCLLTGRRGWPQITGAVLYAFSGFSASALEFYHFHDVVALFPLLLIGIEKIRKRESMLFFAGAVFLNCLLNYYFFIGECFFIIMYFVFRFFGDRKAFLRGMLQCLAGGVLGVGMAGILFVPSILYILGNPRTGHHLTIRGDLLPNLREALYLLKGMLLPGEAMSSQCAVHKAEWNSTAGWLPLTGVSLAIAYAVRKKDWLAKFLLFLTVIAFSPFLSSGFSMFTRNYQRWWFMFVLILAAAAVYVMEDSGNYPVGAGVACNLLLTGLWLAAVIFRHYVRGTETVYHPLRMLFLTGIAGGGLLLVLALHKNRRLGGRLMAVCTACVAALTTFFTIRVYLIGAESTQSILDKYSIAEELDVIDPQYRYALENNKNLLTLTGDVGGVGAFTSTCGNYRFRLNALFDYSSSIFSLKKSDYPGLQEMCGAKHVLTDVMPENGPVLQEIPVRDRMWYVTEQAACPIGYAVDRYMLEEDLLSLPLEKRGIAMLCAPVLTAEEEAQFSGCAERLLPTDAVFSAPEEDVVREMTSLHTENRVTDFTRSSDGLACTVSLDRERPVFFSVPNEQGWEIMVDGVREQPADAGGFVLLLVPEGEHSIRFHYRTPGLAAGTGLSCISLLVFVCLLLRRRGHAA